MSSSYKPIAQGRRTPLSLNSGAAAGKSSFKPTPNSNDNAANSKKDHNKTVSSSQKPEQMQQLKVELKQLAPQQQNSGGKTNNANGTAAAATTTNKNKNSTAADEKKSQNGVSAGNNANTNGTSNTRDKQLNGNQEPKSKETALKAKSTTEKANEKQAAEKEKEKEKEKPKKAEPEARSTRNNAEALEKKTTAIEKKEAERKEADKKETESKEAEKPKDSKQLPTVAKPSTPTGTRSSEKKTPTPSPSKATSQQKPPTPKLSNVSGTATPTKKYTPKKTVAVAIDVDDDDEEKVADVKKAETIVVEDDNEDEQMDTDQPIDAAAPQWTSTPGKFKPTNYSLEAYKMSAKGALPDYSSCPRPYTQISGRRSIRTFNSSGAGFDGQYRESYRRINTELDMTNNTSLNVTVGSEPANNSSFSFSFFGRKRQLPTPAQSTTELQTDVDLSPKRRRVELKGLLSAVASPFTRLGERFARASLMSPFKPRPKQLTNGECEDEESEEQEQDVHNVSDMQDDIEADTSSKAAGESEAEEDAEANKSADKEQHAEEAKETVEAAEEAKISIEGECKDKCAVEALTAEGAEITVEEGAVDVKNNKRCSIM